MLKKTRKLNLSRETLTTLNSVVGGATFAAACSGGRCSYACTPGDTGTESGICNSASVCSDGCETGGACTISCHC
jgi:hypothetical protein